MEITYQNEAPTIRLVKYIERDNFPIILFRISNNLLRRRNGTDLMQLTQ